MRILYHHRTQGRGAEGNHIVSIVTALRSLGHEVDVLSPPGVDPFDPASSVPVDKAATHTRGWSTLWKWISKSLPNAVFEAIEILYNIPGLLRLRRALRGANYDLVYERYAFFMLAGAWAARAAGCRLLLEVNEVSGIPNRARRQSLPALCRVFERRLFARCDAIHAVSSYLGDRVLAQGVPPERLVVVPNGFDIGRLRPNRSRETIRAELRLDGMLAIGFAGWFDHWDRLDFLVDAFAELHRRRPAVRLCLVGDGPAAAIARRRIEQLGLTAVSHLTGAVPRSHVYDYLQVFDIGILPHSNDFGSPIVMFELMGLRVPLVAPRLPPILDVHGSGGTALLFEPLNAESCVQRLLELVDSPELRTALADRALAKLSAEHSWPETARRILAALR